MGPSKVLIALGVAALLLLAPPSVAEDFEGMTEYTLEAAAASLNDRIENSELTTLDDGDTPGAYLIRHATAYPEQHGPYPMHVNDLVAFKVAKSVTIENCAYMVGAVEKHAGRSAPAYFLICVKGDVVSLRYDN